MIKTTNSQIDKRLADAWRELFTRSKYEFDPLIASELDGDLFCFFCREWIDNRDENQHKEDCIYMRVKSILAMEQATNEVD